MAVVLFRVNHTMARTIDIELFASQFRFNYDVIRQPIVWCGLDITRQKRNVIAFHVKTVSRHIQQQQRTFLPYNQSRFKSFWFCVSITNAVKAKASVLVRVLARFVMGTMRNFIR